MKQILRLLMCFDTCLSIFALRTSYMAERRRYVHQSKSYILRIFVKHVFLVVSLRLSIRHQVCT